MTTQLQQCREVASALEEECTQWRIKDADWREHRAAAEAALRDMPTVIANYRAALARVAELEAWQPTSLSPAKELENGEQGVLCLLRRYDKRYGYKYALATWHSFIVNVWTDTKSEMPGGYWLTADEYGDEIDIDEWQEWRLLPRARKEGREMTTNDEPAEQANAALRARVAELEAQLAAQSWRPGSETPPAHDWYWVYDFTMDDVPMRRYYGPKGWGMFGDDITPNWYLAIPPLPPAPVAEVAQ